MPELSGVLRRGYMVLVDKDGLKPRLEHVAGATKDSETSTSVVTTDAAFVHLVNDFLYHAVWSAKKLCRGELWTAKMCCDGFMKRQLRFLSSNYLQDKNSQNSRSTTLAHGIICNVLIGASGRWCFIRLARHNLGIASLIVGLAGLITFKLSIFLCGPLCILGVVLAVMARKESSIILPILGGTFSLMGLAMMSILIVLYGLSIHDVNSVQVF